MLSVAPSHRSYMLFAILGGLMLVAGFGGITLALLNHPVLLSVWNWLILVCAGVGLIFYGDQFDKDSKSLEEYRRNEQR